MSVDFTIITFLYVNYRGVQATRKVRPIRLWFGSTGFHPDAQWLLEAFDLEKQATRDFAMSGILGDWKTAT